MASPAPAPRLARRAAATLALLGIVGVAIWLRLLLWRLQSAGGAVIPGDPEEYYRAALHLLRGGYYDTGKWLRPPLYPLALALFLALSGGSIAGALGLQAAALGLATLVFVGYAWQRFGSLGAALLSGLIAALFVPFAGYSAVPFAEPLFMLLMVAALGALDRAALRADWRWAALGGALLGMATLTRAVGLLFIPALALWYAWALTRRGAGGGPRRLLPWLGALLLGAAAVIAPWTIRNAVVHQRLIAVDTNGGISLWYGTIQGEAEQAAGEAQIFAVPNLADRQSLAMRLALENIRADPLRYLVQMRFKVASLLQLQTRDYATGQLITVSPPGELVAVNGSELPPRYTVLADAQYILIVLLAVAGLWFAAEPRRTAPALLLVAYCTALSALTIGHPRLRLPILAVMIPYAAYALTRAPAALRRAGRLLRDRRAWAAAACWLLFAALIFTLRFVPWLRAEPLAAQARSYRDQGDLAAASALFAQARERDPRSPMRLFEEADTLLSRGQVAEARERYERGAQLEPRSLYGRAMLAAVDVLQGDPAGARAELDRVREAGYDRDDLWAWAWRRASRGLWPLPAPGRLVPGDPAALGFAVGFAPATTDLGAGRWTQGAAQIRLAGRCGELSLALRGPGGRVARVTTDAGASQDVLLTGEAQSVTMPVDDVAGRCGDTLLVSIQSPTGLLDIDTDPWQVGVAVSEARLDIK